MAKFKFGSFWSDGRGRLGNLVFSKNLSGSYSRAYIIPPNPNTTYQQDVRTLFKNITQKWSTLTNTQRNSWNLAVKKWYYNNVFRERKFLTGHLLFNKLNLQAQNAQYPELLTAPEKIIIPVFILNSVVFTNPPRRITINLSASDVSVKLLLYATPALPQLAYSWKKTIRLLGVLNSTSLPSNTVNNLYRTKFGNISAGANIYFGIKKVLSNGQSSPIQVVKMIT